MIGVKTNLNIVKLAKIVLIFVDGLSVFSLFTEIIFWHFCTFLFLIIFNFPEKILLTPNFLFFFSQFFHCHLIVSYIFLVHGLLFGRESEQKGIYTESIFIH
jgi:hypothetical protein